MILVLAGTGNVGRATLQALLTQGAPADQIAAGARDLKEAATIVPEGIHVRLADYNDRPGLETAFRGVETLILIPTMTPAAQRCGEHGNALSAAKAAGV